MRYHRKTNSLILKLSDPERVTENIPSSRVVSHGGKQYTQVHVGLDEMRVLRNLGINAPSPVRFGYNWPSRYDKPFAHQITTTEFLTLNPKAICLNDMGTGKTLSALWAADYLMHEGKLRKAIIVCPLSVMSVWANELHGHFMFKRTCAVLHGSKERRLKLLASDVDFYIINHEGLNSIRKELNARTDIDLWMIDEAAAYRNARTDRYEILHGLVKEARWLWMFTGTPCPTSPTDAWALAKLLKNPKAPKYFNGFRDQVMHQITAYKWIPKKEAYDTAFQLLQPGIRFRKEDCIDLPAVTMVERECELTPAQHKAYAEMHTDLVASISGQSVSAANAAVKLSKLLQVCTGSVYDECGGAHALDSSARMRTCLDLVEEASHKVIVFVPFTAALHDIAAYLRKHGQSVAVVDGSVSRNKRSQIFDAFQNENEPRVLVAHPATTAHGLTLTRADTTIWYAPIFSLEVFDQANNRMNRPGQHNNMTVAMVSATPLERQLYAALAGKARMQDAVLQLFKKEVGMDT